MVGTCPHCPGPRVPHHCGLVPAVPAGKGKGQTGGRGSAASSVPLDDRVLPVPVPNRGRILGEKWENFKFIAAQTGVQLRLEESSGALQVRITGGRRANLNKAEQLLKDLLDAACRPSARRAEASSSSTSSGSDGKGGKGGKGGKAAKGNGKKSRRDLQEMFEAKQAQMEDLKEQAATLCAAVRRLQEEGATEREEFSRIVKAILPVKGEQPAIVDDRVRDAAKAAYNAACSAAQGRSSNDETSKEEANRVALTRVKQFWKELDDRRATLQGMIFDLGPEGLRHREELLCMQKEEVAQRSRLYKARMAEQAQAQKDKSELASKLERQARALNTEVMVLKSSGKGSSGADRMGGFCALFPLGLCPFESGKCPRGQHGEPPKPSEGAVLVPTSRAKRRLLQQKWQDAGGFGSLVGAWQVRNPRLDLLLRATETDFAEKCGQGSDIIEGWHGTAEENVLSIAMNGFDPKRRCGQAFGAGEYFAKNPNVSIGYAKGGAFMFLCKLVLGKEGLDHIWAAPAQYYVMSQRENRTQALPLFVVQFKKKDSTLSRRLSALKPCAEEEEPLGLAMRQAGGMRPCEARRDAGMTAETTQHLWVGWLSPALRSQDNDGVAADVEVFLSGHAVAQVIPERNGARVGAFVLLAEPIGQAAFRELQQSLYLGRYRISVDDQQPNNPMCQQCVCPRLTGPSRYCRGWNIRGHQSWQWGCSFAHPEDRRPTHGANYRLEPLPKGSAKFDEIQTELRRSAPFFSSDGTTGTPTIMAVRRVENPHLARAYEERRGFLHDKQGFAMEKELWHGTNCKAIPELLVHGLQPPSDTSPSGACPVSGGKGLCTTLCGTGCKHCTAPHAWHKCHMYGLGVYMADLAQKSHRYVREPARQLEGVATPQGRSPAHGNPVYSMLRCRVVLGNPYLIEGNLLKQDAMHDMCWCQDPSEALESTAEQWSVAKGHDAFYVRGLSGAQKAGLGVYNSEYIVFHPYQILPLYQVDYILE